MSVGWIFLSAWMFFLPGWILPARVAVIWQHRCYFTDILNPSVHSLSSTVGVSKVMFQAAFFCRVTLTPFVFAIYCSLQISSVLHILSWALLVLSVHAHSTCTHCTFSLSLASSVWPTRPRHIWRGGEAPRLQEENTSFVRWVTLSAAERHGDVWPTSLATVTGSLSDILILLILILLIEEFGSTVC